MPRIASVVSTLAVLFLAACSSDRSTSSPLPLQGTDLRSRANSVTTACPTLTPTQIDALIFEVFATGSPDANSARGKWDNIKKQQADGNTTEVENKTYDLIDFMMDKQREGKLAQDEESAAKLSVLLKALACFAGIDFEYPVGATGDYVDPTDLDRVIRGPLNQAAAFIPAGAVNQRGLFVIVPTTAAMRTMLDKYPRNFDFALYPNAGFNQAITLGICATTPDPTTLPQLVLGHNIGTNGFELLEPRNVDFLNLSCVQAPQTASNSLVGRVLSAILPKKLYAATFFGVGGVGGAASELSPFGPVDPRIRVTRNTTGTDAPIGGTISPAPSVTLSTPNGTLLGDVEVAFTTSSGSILPPSVLSAGVSGIAAATSWTLGTTPGAVTATATPKIAGAVAVPNVYFIDENDAAVTSVIFNATATAPTQLVVTQAPASGSQFIAGVPHTPETVVEVQDAAGRVVPAFNGLISMNASVLNTTPTQAQTIVGTATVNSSNGVARFNNLAITRTGAYSMSPSGVFGAGALSPVGAYSVVITPASASTITAITPPLPTTSSVNTAYNIVVEVRDGFGNLRPGTTVFFTRTPNPTNAPPTEVVTGTDGRASFTWTVAFGTNTLFASLDAAPTTGRFVEFTTEVAQSTSVSLTCSARGNREAITSTAVRLTAAPRNGSTVRPVSGVQFYFSVNGAASSVVSYPINVTARFTNASGVLETRTTSASVPLRGSASQDLAGLFSFTPAFTPRANTPVIFSFQGPSPIDRDIRVNVGPCGVNDRRCATPCAAKTISSTGFDLFANPIVREGFKIDLFSNN